jgi:hypothetical protein
MDALYLAFFEDAVDFSPAARCALKLDARSLQSLAEGS